jgi:hypothetical protein
VDRCHRSLRPRGKDQSIWPPDLANRGRRVYREWSVAVGSPLIAKDPFKGFASPPMAFLTHTSRRRVGRDPLTEVVKFCSKAAAALIMPI